MFKTGLIKSDVTSIKYFNDEYIFAGVGNFLNIYKLNGVLVNKYRVFEEENVHGIELQNGKLLLFGGGCMQTFTILDASPPQLKKQSYGSLKGWILAAVWLKTQHVAASVMLNKLFIFNADLELLREVLCEDKCILYSAFLRYEQTSEEITVFSGTVFGEILIWVVPLNSNKLTYPVVQRLKGHKGVIFSIHFDKNSGYVCSSSDDRSTILWKIHANYNLSSCKITAHRKCFGHQSRVFRSMIIDDVLVSAGEDSYINVWHLEGTLLRQFPVQGGSIWAMDSRNQTIAVGSTDGSVALVPLHSDASVANFELCLENEILKHIGVLSSDNLVAITTRGVLYYFVGNCVRKIHQHDCLDNYALLEVSNCRKLFSLSGYKGEVFIYAETNDEIRLVATHQTNERARITAFHWLTCTTFATCELGGGLTLWLLHNQVHYVTKFKLSGVKDSWSTAICQVAPGKYVVGDRRGNIYVYKIGHTEPIYTLKNAHNYLGITQLYNLNNTVVSLGRDATLKIFSADEMGAISKDKLPHSWPVALVDGLIVAFSGDSFVVWDYETRGTVFKHRCGGGHRSFTFNVKNNAMTFAYVKNQKIQVVKYHRNKNHPEKIVPGFHANTVNSLKVIEGVEGRFLAVSGGEDTILRISVIGDDYYCPVKCIKSHLSSVRSIHCRQLKDKNNCLMFSGGGRGQIICWTLIVDKTNFRNTLCCEEHAYYEKTEESEVRIMDMATTEVGDEVLLFAATSDGEIKMFRVVIHSNRYQLLLSRKLFCGRKCITKLCLLQMYGHQILATMSTDGNLSFWDVSLLINGPENEDLQPFKTIKIHQSGVVSYHYRFLQNGLLLFLSGGDDGCFVLNLFRFDENALGCVEFVLIGSFRDDRSHCAQVSGIYISDHYLLTSSLDQKLLIFSWYFHNGKLSCQFLKRYNSSVADIQGMECDDTNDCFHIFLYGKGVEYVKFVKHKDEAT